MSERKAGEQASKISRNETSESTWALFSPDKEGPLLPPPSRAVLGSPVLSLRGVWPFQGQQLGSAFRANKGIFQHLKMLECESIRQARSLRQKSCSWQPGHGGLARPRPIMGKWEPGAAARLC